MTRAIAVISAALAALAAGSSAVAQTWETQPPSESWDAAAVAQWDSGVAMVARCQNGDFRLLVQLVAPLAGSVATMRYAFDEGEAQTRLSALAEGGGAVFARHPASFARALLSARSLDLSVTDGEPPQQRYVLDAPASPEALREVLAACEEPLDPAGSPAEVMLSDPDWGQRPTGREIAALYPARAARRGISGAATVECIVTVDGRPEECLIAWERPEGQGFGDATIAAVTQGFRLRQPVADSADAAGSVVSITLRWYIQR